MRMSIIVAVVMASFAASAQTVTTADGKVKVEVLSLKRSEGETVTLRWTVSNAGAESFTMTPGNERLLDIPGRRIYYPGVVSNSCNTPVGQSSTCFAMFATPPAGTKTMTVQFYEKLDLVSGVPVTD